MKKNLLIALSALLCFGVIFTRNVYGKEKVDTSPNESNSIFENYEYEELSYEEYISELVKSENISYNEAVSKVNVTTRGNVRAATYGKFTELYDVYNKVPASQPEYKFRYGVLATWYSPSYSEPWSARKWTQIHSVLVEPGNMVKNFTCYSKSAVITSNYIINFYASVKYTVLQWGSKSGTIESVFAL